jgi:hypothetical protein
MKELSSDKCLLIKYEKLKIGLGKLSCLHHFVKNISQISHFKQLIDY